MQVFRNRLWSLLAVAVTVLSGCVAATEAEPVPDSAVDLDAAAPKEEPLLDLNVGLNTRAPKLDPKSDIIIGFNPKTSQLEPVSDTDGVIYNESFTETNPAQLANTDCEITVTHNGLSGDGSASRYFFDATLGKAEGKAGTVTDLKIPMQQVIAGTMMLRVKVALEAIPEGASALVGLLIRFPASNNTEGFKLVTALKHVGPEWQIIEIDVGSQVGEILKTQPDLNTQGVLISGFSIRFQGDFNGGRVALAIDDLTLHSSLETQRFEQVRAFNRTGVGSSSFTDANVTAPVKVYGVQSDGQFGTAEIDGRVCLIPNNGNIYFNVEDLIVHNTKLDAIVRVTYQDRGTGYMNLWYASAGTIHRPDGAFRSPNQSIALHNTGEWREGEFALTDASFNNRLTGGDFRLTFDKAAPPIAQVQLIVPGISAEHTFMQHRYEVHFQPVLTEAFQQLERLPSEAARMKADPVEMEAFVAALAEAAREANQLCTGPVAQYQASQASAMAALTRCRNAMNRSTNRMAALALHHAGSKGQAYAMTAFETLVPPISTPPKNGSETVAIFATPGEFEPATFAFFAADDYDAVTLRTGPLTSADGAIIPADAIDAGLLNIWRQHGPYNQYQSAPAEIPELIVKDDRVPLEGVTGARPVIPIAGEIKTAFAQGETKQFWITVHLPDDAKPGDYSGTLTLTTTGTTETVLATVTLVVTVLPFTLDDHGKDIGIYLQSNLINDRPEAELKGCEVSERLLQRQLIDLKEHGITAPTCYSSHTGPQDKYIEMMSAVGFRGPIGYMGGFDDPAQLAKINTKFKEAGLGGLAIYLHDEPATDEAIQSALAIAAQAREAGVLTWAAMLNERAVHEIGAKLDINNWMIATEMQSPDYFRQMRSRRESKEQIHKKYWYYWQSLTEHPLTNRTFTGLYLYLSGFDGICPYVYQACPDNLYDSNDQWQVYGGTTFRMHQTTYSSADGPVATIQWEGFREGVDDLRYLTTLKNRLATADPEKQGPAIQAAQALLNDVETITYNQVTARGLFDLRRRIADAIEAFSPTE